MHRLAQQVLAFLHRQPLWLLTLCGLCLAFTVDYTLTGVIYRLPSDQWSSLHRTLDDAAARLGDGFTLILVAVAVWLAGWWRESRRLLLGGKWLLAAIALAAVWTHTIKHLVGRPRPRFFALHGWWEPIGITLKPSFDSFPSGHSLTVMAVLPLLLLLFPRLRLPLLIIAWFTVFGRVYGGDHFFTDVLAGAFLGTLIGRYCALRWSQELLDAGA